MESKEVVDIFPIFQHIIKLKRFPNEGSPQSEPAQRLYYALLNIRCTFSLTYDLNDRSQTRYDSSNKSHERKLYDLYAALLPSEPQPAARISDDWKRLGFQGQNPATDFRGMGVLALDHLLHFGKRYPDCARRTLKHSSDPEMWYTWACVGINITSFLLQLLQSRMLQLYLYSALEMQPRSYWKADWLKFLQNANLLDESVSLNSQSQSHQQLTNLREAFADFYCFVFARFDRYWTNCFKSSAPNQLPPILRFPRIFADFKESIETELVTGQLTVDRVSMYMTNITLEQ